MKKLAAVVVAVMMMAGCASAFAAGGMMTKDEAMQAALNYAGLKAEQVTFTKVHQDLDDGRQVYEIKFVCNGVEYEMDVDVLTGRIFDADRDYFEGYGYGYGHRDHDDFDDDWDDFFDFD